VKDDGAQRERGRGGATSRHAGHWFRTIIGVEPSQGDVALTIFLEVEKWVEAMPCCKASMEESIAMIKSMTFPRFSTPRILISDGGKHFTEKNFKKSLSKLGIEHRVSTAYHPQTNGQTETSNRQLKIILKKPKEKGGKDWSKKLDGALWAY
jgi:transposase InsO family protein